MADSLNAATKYVATHRPDSLGWGPAESLGADIVEGIRRIKAKDGPDLIVWGSSTLTPVLIEHGLADEVLLLVFPVLYPRCRPLPPSRAMFEQSHRKIAGGKAVRIYARVGRGRVPL